MRCFVWTVKIALISVALVFLPECFSQDISASIVRIFAARREVPGTSMGTGVFISSSGDVITAMGTGVFISPTGDVLTAFHVVQGASSVTVYSGTEECNNVQLVAYDQIQDLARIHCSPPGGKAHSASIGTVPANLLTKKGEAYGFPDGKPLSQVSVDFLQNTPISGKQYFVGGKQIFSQAAWNIELLNVEAALPPGMSGAPVVVDGLVVAVISGSESLRSRAPGWAMIAANEKAMKLAANAQRFDNTPQLAMLLPPYSINGEPILKISLASYDAAQLIISQDTFEAVRAAARELDDKYAEFIDSLSGAYEPGPNSVFQGAEGADVLYGRLSDNALAAAERGVNLGYQFNRVRADIASSIKANLNNPIHIMVANANLPAPDSGGEIKIKLPPEFRRQSEEIVRLENSTKDLAGVLLSEMQNDLSDQSILDRRAELAQLVSNARQSRNAMNSGCEECALKSASIISAVGVSAVQRRWLLASLISEAGLVIRERQAWINILSDQSLTKALTGRK